MHVAILSHLLLLSQAFLGAHGALHFPCNVFSALSVLLFGKAPEPIDVSSISDNELASLVQGDMQHFPHLFERFLKPVYRFFFFRLRDRDDAEDLTSITFEKIYLHIGEFEERGVPFSAWIFTIAHRSLIDHFRRTRDVSSIDELKEDEEPSVDFDLQAIDDEILREKLWNAIKELSPRFQQLWALKLSSGLSHKEIATILDTTENNVNVMVHRSVAMLKEKLSHLAS